MIIVGGIAKMMKGKEEKRRENSGYWFYCHFRDIFGALYRVHFIHTIYRFKAREVRSPTLQTVSKSELKRKSYGHCKKTGPSWAGISHTSIQGAKIFAPCETPPSTRVPFHTPQAHFRTVWNKVRKFRTPLFKVRIHFKVRKSQFKVHQFRTPQSKVRKNFRIVRNTSWNTSAISHTSSQFSHGAKQGANSSVQSMEISHDAIQGAKFSF